jgi:hypothetical protein
LFVHVIVVLNGFALTVVVDDCKKSSYLFHMFERVTGLKGGSDSAIRKTSKMVGDVDRRMRRRRKRHLDQMDEVNFDVKQFH